MSSSTAKANTTDALLTAPPFTLLMRLTAPNIVAYLVASVVALVEVWIVGQLGTTALAAMALVFPLLMLFQTISGGAFGGAVASAIARSLGRREVVRAERLIWHAIFAAFGGAFVCLVLFLFFGRAFLELLGGSGDVLALAMQYCWYLFLGGVALWLLGIVSAVFRGAGQMSLPASVTIIISLLQIPLTGGVVLGWFGLPQLGMPGAALSAVVAATLANIVFIVVLATGRSTLRLRLSHFGWDSALFEDILVVARPATLNPLMTVSTLLGLTALVGRFGPEALAGYGIGARIEYIMLPVIFGFGTALTTIVGTNVGAGQIARAERAGMIGAICAASFAASVGWTLALTPDIWIPVFAQDEAAFEAARTYIHIVGPFYPLLGGGLVLYFAAQGAGAMFWPILATFARLVVAVGGAALAVYAFGAPINAIYWAAGLGMTIYAIMMVGALRAGAWRRGAVAKANT